MTWNLNKVDKLLTTDIPTATRVWARLSTCGKVPRTVGVQGYGDDINLYVCYNGSVPATGVPRRMMLGGVRMRVRTEATGGQKMA